MHANTKRPIGCFGFVSITSNRFIGWKQIHIHPPIDINTVHRIIPTKLIQIDAPKLPYRILGYPPAQHRTVIPKPMINQPAGITFFGGERETGRVGAGGGKLFAEGGVGVFADDGTACIRGHDHVAAPVAVEIGCGNGGVVFKARLGNETAHVTGDADTARVVLANSPVGVGGGDDVHAVPDVEGEQTVLLLRDSAAVLVVPVEGNRAGNGVAHAGEVALAVVGENQGRDAHATGEIGDRAVCVVADHGGDFVHRELGEAEGRGLAVLVDAELDADEAVAHGVHRGVGRDPAARRVPLGVHRRLCRRRVVFYRGGGVGGAGDRDRAVADVAGEFVGAVGGECGVGRGEGGGVGRRCRA